MTDISRIRFEDLRTTIMSHNHSQDNYKVRFISPEKWKTLMLKSLELVKQFNYADADLIHDLRVIINNISQDKFIQAILSFQPFKPKFKQMRFLETDLTNKKQSTMICQSTVGYQTPRTKLKKDSSIIEKGSIILKKKHSIKKQPKTCQTLKSTMQKDSFLKECLQVIIQQQNLTRQIQKKYHPFKKIIDSFVFILENKYKNVIENTKKLRLQKMQQLIAYDILTVQKLFVYISQPFQSIFQSQNPQQMKLFRKKMHDFMTNYVHNHQKISLAIRKIMRHYARKSKSLNKIQFKIQDFIEIQKFQIPDDFKIDGGYVQAMSSLMEFAETQSAKDTLSKLQDFRSAIAADVDFFYAQSGTAKQRQINAQVQIQIIRYIVCKLKSCIPQIYAQLKFLEVVYGDQEIAYKYDDASYIYAQLITVFDALEIQCSIEDSETEDKSILSTLTI